MKAQHTPGPWRIDYDGTLCAPKDDTIGRKWDIKLASFPWGSFKEFNEPENKANARLIAAAPDLLAACKDIESKVLDFEAGKINWRPDDFLHRVRLAITKAEGRQ